MLGDKNVMATVAVKDLDRARGFYGGTLGLTSAEDSGMDVLLYHAGESRLVVYKSDFAGTNMANAVTWAAGKELESIVATLKKKGVTFEHYEMPGATLKGDIHYFGDFGAAWFKDPDGNILHLNSADGSKG